MTCQAPTLLEKITKFFNDGFQKPITTFVNDGLQKPNNFSMMGCKNQLFGGQSYDLYCSNWLNRKPYRLFGG